MLGKTSEVAAAAEQSAVAMREAAQTVYFLILLARPARFDMKRKGRLLQQLRGK